MQYCHKTLPLFFIVFSLIFSQISLAYTYELTEIELQEKLNDEIFEHKDPLLSVSITSSKITLIEKDNQVKLSGDVNILLLGQLEGKGYTSVQGRLEYNIEQGAFYFKDAKIIDLTIDNISPEYLPVIKKALEKALKKGLKNKAIYVLDDNDLKQKLAKSQLNSVNIKGKSVVFDFSLF
ncbi:MAG: DUF1439 domain-containing protein [Pseudomonadales bacterium]|nr:DUF1439 domain-containing protein [Pseudomonadales bacterium]